MKYIVDVPDNTTWIQVSTDRLEPYTEPDRKAIEDEVWELVCKFVWAVDDKKILGTDILHAVRDMSYQEVKGKYEAWLKKKDEIRVGDEVEDADGFKGIVLDELLQDSLHILDEDGELRLVFPKYLHKTGRHFDEVETLLKKMKEG